MEKASAARPQSDDGGFTVIEMVVAITIMAITMMALATTQYGGLKAMAAARQRSAFIELGNAYMEQLRALPSAQVGVDSTDPDLATAYPSGLHAGLPAVVLTGASPAPPAAVELVTTSEVKGIVLPFTVRRWVTRDPASGNDDLRRLEVQLEWSENRRSTRSVSLTSVWYPGGLGTDPPTNAVPVISSSGSSPSAPGIGVPVTFTTSAFDPDADGISVRWQFGDGVTGSGSTATHAYTAAGVYSVVLEVLDTRGGTTTSTFNVTVSSVTNTAPVAAFQITSATSGAAPFTVNVSGSSSQDPDGDALTYLWTWGDGTTGAGVNAGHEYTAAGPYSITLTVTDTSGATSTSAAQTVNVNGGCAIADAWFENPATSSVKNDIDVVSSNNPKPESSQFEFHAVTNLNCGSVTWSLQTASTGSTAVFAYQVSGATATVSGSQKIWTVTNTIGNSLKFPLGAALTGFATSGSANHSFTFSAHV